MKTSSPFLFFRVPVLFVIILYFMNKKLSIKMNEFLSGNACFALVIVKNVINGKERDSIFRIKQKKRRKEVVFWLQLHRYFL
jgi:hypothetical protein